MRYSDQLALSKRAAHPLAQIGGLSVMLPLFPFSTTARVAKGEGLRGAGAGMTTDIGRATGSGAGLGLMKSLPVTSGPMRLALMLAGMVTGGAAGHTAGKAIGEVAFNPESLLKRIKNHF